MSETNITTYPTTVVTLNIGPKGAAGSGSSYDQSLNTTDSPTFHSVGIEGKFFTLDGAGNLLFNGSGIGGGNPFDQSLNTGDSPDFASLGIGGVFLTNDSGNLLWNGSPIGGASYDQSLNTTDVPTFSGLTIDGVFSFDAGAVFSDGNGNIHFFSGYDGDGNAVYTTLNGGQLLFGWAPNYQAVYAGIDQYGVSVGDGQPSNAFLNGDGVGGTDGNFDGWGLSSESVGSGGRYDKNWSLGAGGLSLTTGWITSNSGATIASIDGATGKVVFDAGGIISDGSGNLTAASFVAASTTTPSAPVAGQIYFDGTNFKGWNGSAWKQLDN